MDTSSSNFSGSSITPVQYIVTTKYGTASPEFEDFIKTLPDRGAGIKSNFPNTPVQSYLTYLTPEQAKDAASHEIVQLVILNTEVDVSIW